MRRLILTLLLSCIAAAQNSPNHPLSGTIRGTVQDELGAPAASIAVYLDTADGRIKLGTMRHVQSDKRGHFVFDNLAWGRYRLYAMNEESGYPDTTFAFYASAKAPSVDLAPENALRDITIRLGPKAGVIAGKVTDKTTQEPVKPTFRLTNEDDATRWYSTSVASDFKILIPSSTNIGVEVTASGYKPWYYRGTLDPTKASLIRLAPGEVVRFDIELTPIAASAERSH